MGTLVGRDAELARLRALLHDAAAGRAVTGLVSGDAGIGKSRLVDEAKQIAERDGFTVLCGQCAEIGDSVPYLPFADAFRTAPPRIEKAIKTRPVLSRLLPDGDEQAHEVDWAGLTRQQMFGAVLSLLSELAAESPVLLVIEDLHWADASTRHLVTFLARMLHRERVAIIGTYRTDDLHRRHPLRGVIAELLRLPMVALIELGPLSAAALAEILSNGQDAPSPLSAATLNSLVERAEGNAYYAEELLTASSCAEGTLPTGLAALLLSRVERVSDAAQQVLRAAAVAGGGAADDLVRAASGLPDDVYEEAVREAAGHQLLAFDEPDGYRFRHALLREAVYADLMPGERTRLHARLASLLAGVPGAAAELAHHSMASHDIPGAFAASVQAGIEAERLGAPAEAHRHYDLALELWLRVEGADRIAGMTRGKLGLKSALAAAASGDVPRAVHLLRRIRDWVSAGARPAADAELRCRVGERLAYHLLQSENKQWYAEALDVAQATVRETLDEPPTWYRARAMATYAIALMAAHRNDDARDWASRAREAARAAGSASVEADALATTGQLALRSGSSDEAIGLFTAAIEQAGATGSVSVQAAGRLPAGRRAAGAGRARRGRQRRPPRGGMGRGGGARPRPVRPGPAAPALPGPLRRRVLGSRAGAGGRVPGPGHPAGGGAAVGDGAVRRRGPGQPGGGRTADLAGAVLGRRVRRLHRARDPGRACPVAGGLRARAGRGGGRDRRGRVARPQPVGDPGDGDRPGGAGRPGGAAAGDRGRRRRGRGGGGGRRAARCRRRRRDLPGPAEGGAGAGGPRLAGPLRSRVRPPDRGELPRPVGAGGGRVRPRLRLRDRADPVAAGRGAGGGRAPRRSDRCLVRGPRYRRPAGGGAAERGPRRPRAPRPARPREPGRARSRAGQRRARSPA